MLRDRNTIVICARYGCVTMAANHQHLRAFHAIALEGGVSRAARRLNVSQPTLSQQLKALEERYGVMLFESRRVPLSLTLAGRDLFALTHKLFATAADIDEVLGETAVFVSGLLRLGSDSPYYVVKLVERLRASHPQVNVQVRMGNGQDVMRWLAEAHIDAALASDPPGDPAFSYEPLASERLRCALPVGHRLSGLSAVPCAAFATETLLLRESTSKTRVFIERVLAEAGVTPRATIELHTRETIREGIAIGLGISAFFDSECPPDARIVYRPLDAGKANPALQSYLVCNSALKRSASMRVLRDLLPEVRQPGVQCERLAG